MSGLSQESRALVDSVLGLDEPTASDKARIQQRLAAQLGAAAFAASAASVASGAARAGTQASVAPKAFWLSGGGKALLSALVLSGTGIAFWALLQSAPAAPAPTPPSARTEAAPAVASPQVESPAAAPAAPVPNDEPATAAPASSSPRRVSLKSFGRAKAQAPVSAEAQSSDTLAAELALLGRAQAALRAGRAAEAAELAAQHRAEFPSGVMREERMAVSALAECASSERREQAEAFLRASANSPLAARVRKACGLP